MCQVPSFEESLVRYFSSLGWRGCAVPVPPKGTPGQEHKGTPGQENKDTPGEMHKDAPGEVQKGVQGPTPDSKASTIWLNAAYLRKYDYSAATVCQPRASLFAWRWLCSYPT